jgi:hypothetical protein
MIMVVTNAVEENGGERVKIGGEKQELVNFSRPRAPWAKVW